jgi:hypothetical protein
LTAAAALAAIIGTALTQAGCYKRVVNARGIGADSSKLRSEYESQPMDFITTETRREDREVRSARDREKP